METLFAVYLYIVSLYRNKPRVANVLFPGCQFVEFDVKIYVCLNICFNYGVPHGSNLLAMMNLMSKYMF